MPLGDLPQAYVLTILMQITQLLMPAAHGNIAEARQAAAATLAGWEPRNEVELRLAARIIMFSLQAGESLAQAADPSIPLTQAIRLRAGAVNLTREAQKAERLLEKLRAAHPIEAPAPRPAPGSTEMPAAPSAPEPNLMDQARKIVAYAQDHGFNWSNTPTQPNRAQRRAGQKNRAAA